MLKATVLLMNWSRARVEVFHFEEPRNLGPNFTGNLICLYPSSDALTIVYKSRLKSLGPSKTAFNKSLLKRVGWAFMSLRLVLNNKDSKMLIPKVKTLSIRGRFFRSPFIKVFSKDPAAA